ncbi:oxygen-independent coproporphyrinogen-3 oxidase [Pseudooceanicola antarcticus]|uniref:Coproporphyrinogen-III oxidase n=1 Tax=Pseudooceanicola antarcticus TaxID=1247613 RepID=A0A285I0G1_9RHOB|nr:oxygen-independent coproporphyrinogen III oxidase [Pseudooceanicola antarcticus]PJE30277.1 oxygen-independent coproporphyrinogen III oxidase [Pseudooceanicola antarcticus]SNY41455.1 oxygen-independent coproporphyrinogen-3 oxidase [Pseudooceanicola antarcticus]
MVTKTQLEALGLFDAKVPRYTSYPTAPHFSDAVGSELHGNWIEALPEGARISLYVHVPFCRRLCWFCACRTQGTQSEAPVRAYLDTLLAELDMLAQRLPAGVRLSRLHWGGGTPTLLAPDMMETLAGRIAEILPFAEGAEFSVEIDPNEVDEMRLAMLKAAGMNRASIGVQDFDPEIQKCIGRDQSYEVTRDVIAAIRAHGVESLNADILFGLPHQTRGKITESVQKLLSLSPDRVALYGYAHVPWMARRQGMLPSDALPTPAERLELFATARKLFLWDGYAEIGIDHFALPEDGLARAQTEGRLKRNFQGYTDDQAVALIGIGASSISRFPQGFTQNAPATGAHTQAIREGHFSTAKGHAFAGEDRLRARLIEAVMCDFRIRSAEIRQDFGLSDAALQAMFQEVAARFDGLVQVTAEGLFIPEEARPLTRLVARAFDAYDGSRARHSSAI